MDPSESWTDWEDRECDIRAGVHGVIRNNGEDGNAGTTTLHVRMTPRQLE